MSFNLKTIYHKKTPYLLAMFLLALTSRRRRPVMMATAFSPNVPKRQKVALFSSSSSSDSEKPSVDEKSATPVQLSSESYANQNNRRDQVFSAISKDGGIKVTAATVRNMVNDMSMQHTMTPVPADALGRTLVCGLLMANGMQDEQTVQITMNSKFSPNRPDFFV